MTETPQRALTDHRITSMALPAMVVDIDPTMTHLGTITITIRGIAEAEIYLFGVLEGKWITKQLVVQFESFLPDANPDYRYNYDTPQKITLAGEVYNTDTRCAPAAFLQSFAEEPETDSAQVDAFLKSKGYERPYCTGEVVWKRIMRALGQDKRSEVLFIYTEPHMPDPQLVTREDDYYLVHADQMANLADFTQRAMDSFRVHPL